MKPHALRKTLWFANIALIAAVVGIGVWGWLKVRPATAAVTGRPRSYRPPEIEKLRKKYESERQTGLKWAPNAPVSEAEIQKYILIKKFDLTNPKHWIFSGPLPPTKIAGKAVEAVVEEGPKHLETLGSVRAVIFQPPKKSVVLFAFTGGKRSRAFGLDEWVLETSDSPMLYKITGIEDVSRAGGTSKAYRIHYAVYGKDKEKPRMEGVMPYGSDEAQPWPGFLRPVAPKVVAKTPQSADGSGANGTVPGATLAGAAPGAAGGAAEGAGEGTGDLATPAGTTAEGAEVVEAETGEDGASTVIEVARIPADQITLEDMRPEVRVNPNNRNERAVILDDNTYRALRGKRAKDIAGTVKTEVAVDRKSGRTLGMRITGLKEGSAAGALQVKKGDILVSINGRRIESRSSAISIIESLDAKSIVTVVIDRHGKLLTYKVDPSDPKTRRQVRYFDNLK